MGLIYIGDYGQHYFNPTLAYPFNKKAYKKFKDAASEFVLAKNEYFIHNIDRSIFLFSQLHIEYPKNENYLVSLILIKGEKNDKKNLDMLLQELKRRFPDRYKLVRSQIAPGRHIIRWSL